MRIMIYLILLSFLYPSATTAQNVGVNTTNPQTTLDVNGTATTDTLFIKNANSSLGHYISNYLELRNSTNLFLHAGYGGSGNNDITFKSNNQTMGLFDGATKNFAMGTFTPKERIDINGAIKIQDAVNEEPGTIQWDGNDFLGQTGTEWKSLTQQMPPPPIDTTRNLASDFELAQHLCDCPNLPPFIIQQLLDAGYTPEQLVGSGIPVEDVINAQRGGILIDSRDNQAYKTVTIGTQTWMAENLNIGTRIDGANNQIDNDIIEKYCNDNLSSNCDTFGGLYQWNEKMLYSTVEGTQGICPSGWHLPTDEEWKTLEMALGMTQAQADATGFRGTDQGSQLAGNETLWSDGLLDQNGVFGSSGFDALPAGLFSPGGTFNLSTYAYFWTSSEIGTGANARNRELYRDDPQIFRVAGSKSKGFSVRCVQD